MRKHTNDCFKTYGCQKNVSYKCKKWKVQQALCSFHLYFKSINKKPFNNAQLKKKYHFEKNTYKYFETDNAASAPDAKPDKLSFLKDFERNISKMVLNYR